MVWSVLASTGVYMLWLLLPLIPAVVIYLLFPETPTQLEGKIGKFTLKASGAFAAYLALIYVSSPQLKRIDEAIQKAQQHIEALHKVWLVKGEFEFVDGQGKLLTSDQFSDKIEVVLHPKPHSFGDRRLMLKVVEESGDLPEARLQVDGFHPQSLEFLAKNPKDGTIAVKTIRFTRDVSTSVPLGASSQRVDLTPPDSSARR